LRQICAFTSLKEVKIGNDMVENRKSTTFLGLILAQSILLIVFDAIDRSFEK